MSRKNTITTEKVVLLGIDTAKNVFQLHGVDTYGKAILKKRLRRAKLVQFISNFPPCTIAIEACGASHHWARTFSKLGHEVKLLSAQHVKPFVKSNKNDAKDAEAICEAASRPSMRFVAVKTVRQQNIQALHRVRDELKKVQTAQCNQIRGILAEYGVVIPKSIHKLYNKIPRVLEDTENNLTTLLKDLIRVQYSFACELRSRLDAIYMKIEKCSREDEAPVRLQQIPGIGPLGSSLLHAAVGNGRQFKCGRNMSAWLGLVPRQHSTGDKKVLLGISKKGNRKLRQVIIQGARTVVRWCKHKNDPLSKWLQGLLEKKGFNKTAVALANKNIRVAWAILAKNTSYNPAT